jgi:hypothetical protein
MLYQAGAWEDYRWSWGYRPNWRDLIKQGLDATTKLEAAKLKFKLSEGLVMTHLTSLHGTEFMLGNVTADLMVTKDAVTKTNLALESTATSLAQTNFVRQIRKASRTFNGGPFVGQIKQAADLVKHPLQSFSGALGTLYSSVAKLHAASRFKTESRTLKDLGDMWLGWHFGVQPTLSDLKDATTAFSHAVRNPRFDMKRLIGTGVAESATRSVPVITMNPSGFGNGFVEADYEDKQTFTTRYIGGWKNGNPSEAMPVFRDMGLDLSSFVPTLWEVVPFSWMVDYVTNCGDVLDAWSCRLIDLAWCVETKRLRRVQRCSPIRPTKGGNTSTVSTTAYGGAGSSVSTYVTRVAHSNDWSPALLWRIPGFASSKGLNIAALLAQSHKISQMRWK